MRRFVAPLVIVAPLLILATAGGRGAPRAAQQGARPGAVKVTITTGGGLFGPVRESFRVGQRIPVVITMTNEGPSPSTSATQARCTRTARA